MDNNPGTVQFKLWTGSEHNKNLVAAMLSWSSGFGPIINNHCYILEQTWDTSGKISFWKCSDFLKNFGKFENFWFRVKKSSQHGSTKKTLGPRTKIDITRAVELRSFSFSIFWKATNLLLNLSTGFMGVAASLLGVFFFLRCYIGGAQLRFQALVWPAWWSVWSSCGLPG